MMANLPNSALVRDMVESYRPQLWEYADFYRDVHRRAELAGMEKETAEKVIAHLTELDFTVHSGIGGHGVAGVLKNGTGKTILMRAELYALPILEETNVPYRSERRRLDRYYVERPTMHACGHDMNMAALLAAAGLLRNAAEFWNGILVVVFEPGGEESTGAKAMLDGGLYDLVPVPDIMLGQHVVPARAGTVAIRSSPVLVGADTMRIRVIGGPCEGSTNPQSCVDPTLLAMRIVSGLQDAVTNEVGQDEYATVACLAFHAGVPEDDYIACRGVHTAGNDYADVLLDIKTVKPDIRQRVLDLITKLFLDRCRAAGVPRDPEINHSVLASLTSNRESIVHPIDRVFREHFTSDVVDMDFVHSIDAFSVFGADHDIPYAYWNFGGIPKDAKEPLPTNHSPFFAPEVDLTLKTGTDAMALAALTFLLVDIPNWRPTPRYTYHAEE
ncbi:hypothetical protein B0I37DRAFT_333707 [Chaetomium sp. MPI-CAGE-AT-0009]|nr:hypothetical protein B0I37DRAFT_333707 [Chaetomium sp. MPI-CAGE-AT-0009]